MLTRPEIDALSRAVRCALKADLRDAADHVDPLTAEARAIAAHARNGNCAAILKREAALIPEEGENHANGGSDSMITVKESNISSAV